jgi:hypothetical protein
MHEEPFPLPISVARNPGGREVVQAIEHRIGIQHKRQGVPVKLHRGRELSNVIM